MTGSRSSDWTPERRAKIGAMVKARFEKPGECERISEIHKARCAREKAQGIKHKQNPEHCERMRQRCLAWNADPVMREVRRAAAIKLWESKAHREKMSRSFRIAAGFSVKRYRHVKKLVELNRERWANDPEHRERTLKRLKEARQKPGVREKIIAGVNTPKAREAAKRPRPRCDVRIPRSRWVDYYTYRSKGFSSVEAVERMGLR